jgi:hypothetical protein
MNTSIIYRYLMTKDTTSAIESNEIVVRLEQERPNIAFQPYKPPLIPRPPTVQPESSSIRDSSGADNSFQAISL